MNLHTSTYQESALSEIGRIPISKVPHVYINQHIIMKQPDFNSFMVKVFAVIIFDQAELGTSG